MNRLLRLALVLALPTAAVIIIVLSNERSQSSSSMRALVIGFVTPFLDHGAAIDQYVQARLPQNFRSEMSKMSYGDTPYYVTDQRTNPNHPGIKPLPYPPNDVWCVKLKGTDPMVPGVVVLALHQDMYNAAWVMHEVTDPDTVLAAVGCQLSDE